MSWLIRFYNLRIKRMLFKKIIIIGGGTSGWMAAAALSRNKAFEQCDISLVESEKIGTIGVGEGSTPYLKKFMNELGIDEKQWMDKCDATYKTGIKFENWNGDNKDYFHPFFTDMDVETAEIFFNAANGRRRGKSAHITGDQFFIASNQVIHKLKATPNKNIPVKNEYGYHFDAVKLAALLKEYACQHGVEHVIDDVVSVSHDKDGIITSVTLSKENTLSGDFFIDASGFSALLIGNTLNERFESFEDELLNDSAVAVSSKITNYTFQHYTKSTALSAGWSWQIPLRSRTGNGYVYSSKYLSKEKAEMELAEQLGLCRNNAIFKHLKMKVGLRKNPWKSNVLSIGLAHSFIEPLEATALMITQRSIELFIKAMSSSDIEYKQKQQRYNKELTSLVLGVKDYIVAHYATSQRKETEYWLAASTSHKDGSRLTHLLNAWLEGVDFEQVLYQYETELAYFRPSWYILLAGMDYRNINLAVEHDRVSDNLLEQARVKSESLAKFYYAKAD